MTQSRPYARRLIALSVVVAALLAVVVLVPDKPRGSVSLPPGSIFDSRSAPYEYFDQSGLGWQEYTYVARPVYQSRIDFMSIWAAGAHGCYVLAPADDWAAEPDLRDQVVRLMSRFEEGTYSYDPGTLANLPTFSPTCASGQQSITITIDDLGQDLLGQADIYGTRVYIARGGDTDDPAAIHWCASGGHEDGSCYQLDAILMHELGHILGLAHSSPGGGPGPALTIMSVEASDWDSDTNPQFGNCDMAGLQARYGLASPDSEISPCLPPIGTKVALAADGNHLTAKVAVDPSTIATAETEVTWFDGEPPMPVAGRWETYGLNGQPVHRTADVELWQRDSSAGSVQDRRVGTMTYTASPGPIWTIDLPAGTGGTYFARFVGDGTLLADDSDPVSI